MGSNWEDKIRQSDMGKACPEAAERLIADARDPAVGAAQLAAVIEGEAKRQAWIDEVPDVSGVQITELNSRGAGDGPVMGRG